MFVHLIVAFGLILAFVAGFALATVLGPGEPAPWWAKTIAASLGCWGLAISFLLAPPDTVKGRLCVESALSESDGTLRFVKFGVGPMDAPHFDDHFGDRIEAQTKRTFFLVLRDFSNDRLLTATPEEIHESFRATWRKEYPGQFYPPIHAQERGVKKRSVVTG